EALAGSGSSGKCKTPPPTRTASPTQTRTRTSSPTPSLTRTPTPPTPTPACSAELCVFKFNDLNGDGVHDPGEPGLAGWTMHVTDPNMNVVANMATGAQGSFCIGVPAPVTYTVSEVPQNGWTQTSPPAPGSHIFTIQCGQLVNVEFGNAQDATRTPTRTLTRTATATATATRTPTRTSNIPPID
ncbi:MAG TPA: SdrD B-like domain-containing protein, partial [Candidatus Dormibacteraeota bacterium]|nr:SdrD B-like domain-containing protein [Candidatus Dormibacteraeota bacterium]